MRVAVIENRLKDYIINVFNQHSDSGIEISAFLEWKPQQEQYKGIEIRKIQELYMGEYDAILIAIKENRYLSRLLTYLHKKRIQNVHIIRLFTLDMQEDFISETRPLHLDSTRVDRMPLEDEKPYLVHLETHVCDHCNLNCKACNNFSPFVKEPAYADINKFERDLKRLTELFSGIGRFFLLGGEPLLAPELCCDMVRCFRRYFPNNELRVLTNATLILSMNDEFWDCVRENDAIVHISLYPPVRERINEIRRRLEDKDIRYIVFKEVETFAKRLTLYPFEDENHNNERCGSGGCHYLRDGEISKCPDAILVGFMTDGYEEFSSLKSNDSIKLSEETDAWRLIEKVDNPIDLCKKCTHKRLERIKWERIEGEAQPSDWLLPHRYEAEVEEIKCDNEKANNEIQRLKNKVEALSKEIQEQDRIITSYKERISAYEITEKELKKKCEDINNFLKKAQQEYVRIDNSYSHKIGRAITWLPRKCRRIAQKYGERLSKAGCIKSIICLIRKL